MSNRTNKILVALLAIGVLSVGCYKLSKPVKVENLHGYNELANEDSLRQYTTSEYNTDLPGIANIKRPEVS